MGLWSRLNQFYPVWLEAVIVALLVASFSFPLANYGDMPARIPTHFDVSGLPDAWSDKTPSAVLLGSLIAAVSYGGLTLLSWWVAVVDDPKKVINASKQRLAAMSKERAEQIRRVTLTFLFAIKFLLVAMLAYLSYAQTEVALGARESLGWPFTALAALLLVVCGFLTWRVLALVYGPERSGCGRAPVPRPPRRS